MSAMAIAPRSSLGTGGESSPPITGFGMSLALVDLARFLVLNKPRRFVAGAGIVAVDGVRELRELMEWRVSVCSRGKPPEGADWAFTGAGTRGTVGVGTDAWL